MKIQHSKFFLRSYDPRRRCSYSSYVFNFLNNPLEFFRNIFYTYLTIIFLPTHIHTKFTNFQFFSKSHDPLADPLSPPSIFDDRNPRTTRKILPTTGPQRLSPQIILSFRSNQFPRTLSLLSTLLRIPFNVHTLAIYETRVREHAIQDPTARFGSRERAEGEEWRGERGEGEWIVKRRGGASWRRT